MLIVKLTPINYFKNNLPAPARIAPPSPTNPPSKVHLLTTRFEYEFTFINYPKILLLLDFDLLRLMTYITK